MSTTTSHSHGEAYYNYKYSTINNRKKTKELKDVYSTLGFDASNQLKVIAICRQYDAASEAWANIICAEVCGGAELDYEVKYLPNTYAVLTIIIKGAI